MFWLALVTLMLSYRTDASRGIQDLINDITEKDNHYYNDIRPEEYSGTALLGEETVNVTFKVGQGFRGQVIEEESEILHERTKSLKKSAIWIRYQGRERPECRIKIGGGELVRNYIRLYRMMKEVDENRPSFIKIEARRRRTAEKILIPLFQNVRKSRESSFKYLPYQLTHFPDLFMLTVSQETQERYFIKLEMTVSDGCLPPLPRGKDINRRKRASEEIPGDFGNGTGRSYETKAKDEEYVGLHSVTQDSSKDVIIESGTDEKALHSCDSNFEIPDDVSTCYDVNYDVVPTLRHLYMLAVQMQHIFLMRYHGNVGDDVEVCSVKLAAGAASSTKTNFEHTMVECCHVIIGRQKLFRAGELEQGWKCHDPYSFSKLLLEVVGYITYVLLTLLPMAITILPSIHQRGNEEEEKELAANMGNDAESVISDITGRRLRDERMATMASDNTPETLSLERSDDEDGKADNIFIKLDENKKNKVSKPPEYDLIFINEDPVYKFGVENILWYLLLFCVKSHYLTVGRRLLFLYVLWLFHYIAALQMYLFYINIYELKWQAQLPSMITFSYYSPYKAYEGEEGFQSVFLVYALIVPLIFAVVQFIVLSPLLTDKRCIANVLYWDEHQSDIGRYMGVDLRDTVCDFNMSYEKRLVRNLYARLFYIGKVRFWKYLFTKAIFSVDVRRKRKLSRLCFICRAMIKVLLVSLVWPFYVLPLFTVFKVFYTFDKYQNSAMAKIRNGVKMVMVTAGVMSLILLFLPFIFFYVCMLLFLVIDVFRNISATLTQAIFILSVLASLRDAFSSLEDEYRTVKAAVFNIIESFDESDFQSEQKYHQNLIWVSEHGDRSIPRVLFEKVCALYMPFGDKVVQVLVGLVRNFVFIALLYALIVDYQILDQFSETGESIITVIFVSLPSLLSRQKSEAESELGRREMELRLRVLILRLLRSEDFWVELNGVRREVETFITSV